MGNAGPGVPDFAGQAGRAAAAADQHTAARRIADGVADEIEQDAFQQHRVGARDGPRRAHAKRQPVLARQRRKGAGDVVQQVGDDEVDDLEVDG